MLEPYLKPARVWQRGREPKFSGQVEARRVDRAGAQPGHSLQGITAGSAVPAPLQPPQPAAGPTGCDATEAGSPKARTVSAQSHSLPNHLPAQMDPKRVGGAAGPGQALSPGPAPTPFSAGCFWLPCLNIPNFQYLIFKILRKVIDSVFPVIEVTLWLLEKELRTEKKEGGRERGREGKRDGVCVCGGGADRDRDLTFSKTGGGESWKL